MMAAASASGVIGGSLGAIVDCFFSLVVRATRGEVGATVERLGGEISR